MELREQEVTSGESGLKPSLNQGGSFFTAGSLPPSAFCFGCGISFTVSCPFAAAAASWPPATAALERAFLSAKFGKALTPWGNDLACSRLDSGSGSAAYSKPVSMSCWHHTR